MKKILFPFLLFFCSVCFPQQQESDFVHLSQVTQPPHPADCTTASALCTVAAVEDYIFSKIFSVGRLSEGVDEKIAIASRIIIDTTGQVTWATVKGLPEAAATKLTNLLKEMPAFTPGRHNGEPVNVIGDFKTTLYISEAGTDFSEATDYSTAVQKPVWYRCLKSKEKDNCSIEAMQNWVNRKVDKDVIKEPGFYAIEAQFVVGKDGKVNRIAIRGGNDALAKEVAKELTKIPAYQPGMVVGAPVNISYRLPIQMGIFKN